MSTFIQLHLLTSYPPANLNRDDLGRPKTAVMGGTQRLRISSQSLKRAWRTSDVFEEALAGHIGTRTKEMGRKIYEALTTGRSLIDIINEVTNSVAINSIVSESNAKTWAKAIAGQFGKSKAANQNDPLQELEIEQLAHFSPEEISSIDALVKTLASQKRAPNEEELNLLRKKHQAADMALFGRMLASNPAYNMEAAAQVAHAITVHKVAVEDDYFTAVDDLNAGVEDVGSAHIGETEFAAGLFYLYICINRDLLIQNLNGDETLANNTIRSLAECAVTIAPTGKQNSFASRAYASYVLAEKGSRQPRSLSVAFLKPVNGSDMLNDAVNALTTARRNMDSVYGPVASSHSEMNASTGVGSLAALLEFVSTTLTQE